MNAEAELTDDGCAALAAVFRAAVRASVIGSAPDIPYVTGELIVKPVPGLTRSMGFGLGTLQRKAGQVRCVTWLRSILLRWPVVLVRGPTRDARRIR